MFEQFALVIAGLGLFFAGLQILTEHLKQLTGRNFRLWVAKWTRNRLMGALWGTAFISITQSGAATTFIVVSLLSSGLIGIVQALPMIVGLNVGGGLMVLIVTSNIKVLVLLVLGFAGIGYASERFMNWRPLLRALFGGGLLFLGLNLVQEGAAPMAAEPWVRSWLEGSAGSPLLGFIAGVILVMLTQSAIAIGVLAIAFTSAGLFTMEQTIMTIYGTNVGSSAGTYLLSMKLSGGPRQVSMVQVFYNVLGALIFVPLFYIETGLDIPLVHALITAISSDIATQASIVYIIFNVTPGLIMIFPLQYEARLLQYLWPPSELEHESRPMYLHKQALNEPELAIDLARKEQNRLFSLLPKVLDIARSQPDDSLSQIRARGEVHDSLAQELNHYLRDVATTNPSPGTFERLSETLLLQGNFERIHNTLSALAEKTLTIESNSPLFSLSRSLIEGLDAVILTINDCLEQGADELELELIDSMVGGRQGALRQIRDTYLDEAHMMDGEQKRHLLEMTNQCEHLFWLLGQLRPVLGDIGEKREL